LERPLSEGEDLQSCARLNGRRRSPDWILRLRLSSDKTSDWRIVWLYGVLGAAGGLGVMNGMKLGLRLRKLPPPR